MRDERFSPILQTHGYLEYGADLSVNETRKLHQQFLPEARAETYRLCGWPEIIQPQIAALDVALSETGNQFSHFRVYVFEWESGLA
jgi:hypothetical protein